MQATPRRFNPSLVLNFIVVALAAMAFLQPAQADPLGAAAGTHFQMVGGSSYQEGCFPPCLCPLTEAHPVVGTMKLVYAGQMEGLHVYSVQEVNWRVDAHDPPTHLTGSGMYRIGSPDATTVIQQRLELQLTAGNNASQSYDSGWINGSPNVAGLEIAVSVNGQYCFDRVIEIRAVPVPDSELQPYVLDGGSTYQFGCFWLCDCASQQPWPMIGDFGLVALSTGSLVNEFAVVNIQWLALRPDADAGPPILGSGFYYRTVGGAVQHRMVLALAVDDRPTVTFDSGWVADAGMFPHLEIGLEHNPDNCVGALLQVAAKPAGEVCGGFVGIPCADPGDFCKTPSGECCCDFLGVCTPTGGKCPAVWDPVCGCDNVTYPSECDADSAGVSIQHNGECGSPCGLPGDPPCDNDSFCKFPAGDCGSGNVEGICTTIPLGCPDYWDPVCGCDGMTYGNECDADAASVSVAHAGVCEQACGGIQDIPCPNGEFCRFPHGTCNVADNQGICRPIPGVCPENWDPVCACDGVTYGNPCEADAAQAPVDHEGPCPPPPCTAQRTLLTANSVYCPGNPTSVRIALHPPLGASALAIEDIPPAGWTVVNVSHDGFFDPAHHAVRWGPFFAPFPSEVTYDAMPANDTAGAKCFTGTVSVDGDSAEICGESCLNACCSRMAADAPQAACNGCPVSGCNFCSNAACSDGRVELCEVIGYACSWLRGCHDDIAGVTRAAYIWRSGECYCWNSATENWVPKPCDAAAAPCCDAGLAPAITAVNQEGGSAVAETAMVPAGRGSRGGHWRISVKLAAPQGTSASALELVIPKGWNALSIEDGGVFDSAHRKIKWGPFLNDPSRTVTLTVQTTQIRPKDNAERLAPTGAPRLRGVVSFDGISRPVQFAE